MAPNLSARPSAIDFGANHITNDNDYQLLNIITSIWLFLSFITY